MGFDVCIILGLSGEISEETDWNFGTERMVI